MEPIAFVVDGATAAFSAGRPVRCGELEMKARTHGDSTGTTIELRIRNPTRSPVSVERAGVVARGAPDLVLEHGYQSWSVVRRCAPGDVRPARRTAAEWGRATHVADPDRTGEVVAGDQYLVTSEGAIGFLGGTQHLSTVEARGGSLHALALLDGVEIGAGEERSLEPMWVATGDPGEKYSELASIWGARSGARVDAAAPVGWCSWYQYFGGVTANDVRANAGRAAELGLGLVQIDDGWQRAIGDWTESSDRFGADVGALADEIRSLGLEAGLWTAPFLASESSRVTREHPDWIATHRSGHPLRAMFNQSWGGWALGLDTTNPAVLDHLRALYADLRAKGFGYHKIDFCYAAATPARRYDPTLTRAQALRAGLDAVRDGIGEDAFLLGCGCPFGPAVGVVDAMRVSADVAPYWRAEQSWPGFEETAPAAVAAIQASVLRSPLHRRVFVNDPDCLLLRRDALDEIRRRILADVIAGVGGFTIVSDDLTRYAEEEVAALQHAREAAPRGDRVLDLVDPFAHAPVVRSSAQELEVDWGDPPRAELRPHHDRSIP